MAQPAPDAAGSGAATAHLPTSVSSQRRVWPVYRRQLDVQHRQGAAAPLQNERAAPAKKERVPILTLRSCASPQESTPSKRRRVSSRVPWHLVWRGGALGRMDVHSQEDLLADAAREGEAPKLRHLLRKLSPNAVGAPFSRPQCRCWPCAPAPVIIHAALGGHAGIIAQLLHAGADPDVRDGDGWTALMYAWCLAAAWRQRSSRWPFMPKYLQKHERSG